MEDNPGVIEIAFDQTSYITEYQKKHTTLFTIRLNLAHDADIIEWLDKQTNKQGRVKELIRAEMEKSK